MQDWHLPQATIDALWAVGFDAGTRFGVWEYLLGLRLTAGGGSNFEVDHTDSMLQ